MEYRPVIGLEVHLQLKTASKIFCGCSTLFGASPNSQVCPVCLGLPGVLPVLNRQVFLYGVRVALGLQCKIQPTIVFHRKNYFYPDLPKGYQISQYDLPLGTGGHVVVPGTAAVPGTDFKVRIHRVHMEEDAGKLVHRPEEGYSLVDLNRAGVPLLEIVSEPDLESPEQAHEYLKTLKGILEYLEVSDCDMEKGSLRCDANISLSPASVDRKAPPTGTKVEIKNLNSFKAVARSLAYEIKRQGRALDAGEKLMQETRLWDDVQGMTQGMRSKEFAHDYRYFPEPDLVPFAVPLEEIEGVGKGLPELPRQRGQRFVDQYELPAADAVALTSSRSTADYYEACIRFIPKGKEAGPCKAVANWLLGDLAREMNERNVDGIGELKFPPAHLVELVDLIDSGKISGKMAKEVLTEALQSGQSPAAVVQAKGLSQVSDRESIRAAARKVLEEQPQAAADYKQGKAQSLMFLVGQLMRKTKGAANPGLSQEVLRELLENR